MPKITLSTLAFVFIFFMFGNAQTSVTVSGSVKVKAAKEGLPFVNVVLKTEKDSAFVIGTVTNEVGRFSLTNIKPGNYFLELSYTGFTTKQQNLFVGSLTQFLDIKPIELEEKPTNLTEVVVNSKPNEISDKLDKKTFLLKDNISQSGGSVLQAMQSLPSVTVQDGKVQLRVAIK